MTPRRGQYRRRIADYRAVRGNKQGWREAVEQSFQGIGGLPRAPKAAMIVFGAYGIMSLSYFEGRLEGQAICSG